jgi:hypothetical protein
MKPGPTLADTLYRWSFSKQRVAGWTDNALWHDALRRAKRFVLDDEMSTFLGELGTQAFVNRLGPEPNKMELAQQRRMVVVRNRKVEALRMGARLPAEVTWIEYNLRNCQTRSMELLGLPTKPLEMPKYEGWLLMRHPKLETAFSCAVVSHDPDVDHGDGFNIWTFPVGLAWTADMDTVLPWRGIPFSNEGRSPSEVSTGLSGYRSDRCGFVFHPLVQTPYNDNEVVANLLAEWSGVQRRMWALLATINDLPVELRDVRAAKGFVARGAYRRFLDHRTITLTVPVIKYTKVIRSALALAHRRGGPVREHWRQDWRRPLSALCDHEWGADEGHMFCNLCKGRKIWVHEHTRGDTSRGFVSHDFTVTHDDENRSKR